MADLQQELMNEVYSKWQSKDCKYMTRLEVIDRFFTPKHRCAVQLGNMNYQVCNGGWAQWDCNNYSEDIDDLIELSKKGYKLGLETFKTLLQMLVDIKALGKASDYNGTEEHTCCECDGSGRITDYDEDDNEIEVECPECYGSGTYDEEINGEEVYGEMLSDFDDKYYAIGEDNLFKDFETLLMSFDSLDSLDSKDVDIKVSIKPRCKLIGEDGNVFGIMCRVMRALKDVGLHEEATEFRIKATSSGSYDEVLRLCMDYVQVY